MAVIFGASTWTRWRIAWMLWWTSSTVTCASSCARPHPRIALAPYDIDIDRRIADLTVGQLTAGPKVQRVAIIGADRTVARFLQTSLKREQPRFAHRFINDFECGKARLTP